MKRDFPGLIKSKHMYLQGFWAVGTIQSYLLAPCPLCLAQQEAHTWSWARAWYILVTEETHPAEGHYQVKEEECTQQDGVAAVKGYPYRPMVPKVYTSLQKPRSSSSLSPCLQDLLSAQTQLPKLSF